MSENALIILKSKDMKIWLEPVVQQVKCYDEYRLLSCNSSMSDTVDAMLGL